MSAAALVGDNLVGGNLVGGTLVGGVPFLVDGDLVGGGQLQVVDLREVVSVHGAANDHAAAATAPGG